MIHICYCCNDGVIRQLLLSVLSVVKHCKKPVALHIATMDLTDVDERWQPFSKKSEEVISAVLRRENADSAVEVLDFSEAYRKHFFGGANDGGRYSPYTLTRLLFDLYPLPDKLIYLDTDTMFLDSVEQLWQEDVGNFEFGAVHDIGLSNPFMMPFFLFHPRYINAGVLLMNMKKIKETGLLPKTRAYVYRKRLMLPDQTALGNYVRFKKVLPRKFNEQRKIRKDTVIKHFCRFNKWYGPISVMRVYKQDEVDNVHEKLKIFCFDDLYDEYRRLAQTYGLPALR